MFYLHSGAVQIPSPPAMNSGTSFNLSETLSIISVWLISHFFTCSWTVDCSVIFHLCWSCVTDWFIRCSPAESNLITTNPVQNLEGFDCCHRFFSLALSRAVSFPFSLLPSVWFSMPLSPSSFLEVMLTEPNVMWSMFLATYRLVGETDTSEINLIHDA